MSTVLAVPFTWADDGHQPGQVDAWLHLPEGGRAAFEITTIVDERAAEVERLACGTRTDTSLAWAWHVEVFSTTNVKEMNKHLPTLLRACEATGATDPDHLDRHAPELLGAVPEAQRWYDRSAVCATGLPAAKRTGRVDVMPGGFGAAVDEQLTDLARWLDELWTTPLLERHLEKLTRTDAAEKHLFLWLYDSGMPAEILLGLTGDFTLPGFLPPPPPAITSLWLATRWKVPVLRWSKGRGWGCHAY